MAGAFLRNAVRGRARLASPALGPIGGRSGGLRDRIDPAIPARNSPTSHDVGVEDRSVMVAHICSGTPSEEVPRKNKGNSHQPN